MTGQQDFANLTKMVILLFASMALFTSCGEGDISGSSSPDASDLCTGVTCSDHGNCRIETVGAVPKAVCKCNEGYQAKGLTCVKKSSNCECNDYNATSKWKCRDSKTILKCNGCSYEKVDCLKACKSISCAGLVGCQYDKEKKHDLCQCKECTVTMNWRFNYLCQYGGKANLAFYDATSSFKQVHKHTIMWKFPEYISFSCIKGHNICYGAWDDKYYWGCGQNCQQSAAGSNNCRTCSTKGVTKSEEKEFLCE